MKAIIFDVDGVLINSHDEFGKRLWQKGIQKDLGLSPDQMHQIYSGNWSSVLKSRIDTRQYFKTVFTKLNVGLSVDAFIEYWLEHDLNINAKIFPVIEAISGIKRYIATNQDSYRTVLLQKKFELYFDGFFSSYKIGAMKPEPEFFRYIEANLRLESKDIAFIDDSKSHVEAAEQLGWTCHHYQNIDELNNFIQALHFKELL